MKKLGLIINPIAGMGGSVGLKGTDHAVAEAIRRGAVPRAKERTQTALSELLFLKEEIVIYTDAGSMGGDLAREMGFQTVLRHPVWDANTADVSEQGNCMETSAADTIKLAEWLLHEQVDIILFAGGDGTARDVYQAVKLDAVCIGIPAGVKIHSPVYAKNPRAAGKLTLLWLTGKIKNLSEEEVLDIEEEQYRKGIINTRLYGYLKIPRERMLTQDKKSPTPLSDAEAICEIAHEAIRQMEPDTQYIIGAGTTTRGIMDALGLKNTLIGVDLIHVDRDGKKELIANDLSGKELLSLTKEKKTKIIVTITGGQGYLFGRGNQQLTPEVIRTVGKDNIMILATKTKLAALFGHPLLVDTYDEELNSSLCGYYRVISGYGESVVCKVSDS